MSEPIKQMVLVCVVFIIAIILALPVELSAQPAMPTPPPRPIPWGSIPILLSGFSGFAIWKLYKTHRE
jgi:hypothetical protein